MILETINWYYIIITNVVFNKDRSDKCHWVIQHFSCKNYIWTRTKGVGARYSDDDCLQDHQGITKTTRPLRKTFDV